jgi:hypothetical protein
MSKRVWVWLVAVLVIAAADAGAAKERGANADRARKGANMGRAQKAEATFSALETVSGKLTLGTNATGQVTTITITADSGQVYYINDNGLAQSMDRLKALAGQMVTARGEVRREVDGKTHMNVNGDITTGGGAAGDTQRKREGGGKQGGGKREGGGGKGRKG